MDFRAASALIGMVDAHERYVRNEPGGRKLIAKYTDWSGCLLQRRVLDDADLTGSDFTGSRLAATSFKFAVLSCADLTGSDLRAADFHRADLRGCVLKGANFYGANLDEADFREAAYVKSLVSSSIKVKLAPDRNDTEANAETEIRRVDFQDCSMRRVKLVNAKLAGADFSGANLSGADLRGADLTGARFEDTILTDVDLTSAGLSDIDIVGAIRDPDGEAIKRIPLIRSAIEAAEIWAATLGKSGQTLSLKDIDLRPMKADLSDIHIPMSRFVNVRALGCDFSRSLMAGSTFERCDFREADFSECDLRGVRFIECRLSGASFRRCRMGGVSSGEEGVITTQFLECRMLNVDLPPNADSFVSPICDRNQIE